VPLFIFPPGRGKLNKACNGFLRSAVNPVMKATLLLLLTVATVVSSCWDLRRKPAPPPKMVWGYKPVFSVDSSLILIKSEGPRDVLNPAKIYVRGNLVFQNDVGIGIHVIDNTDPRNPVRIGFIRIHGNSEMAIKGNYLYANSQQDLVVVDISDWQNLVEVKRIERVFANGNAAIGFLSIPVPERGVHYECRPKPWPHVHTGWVRDSIYDYNCFNP
jgi:hypothetical protein